MNLSHFLYRQRARWKYHVAKTDVARNIAEINRNSPHIEVRNESYFVPMASIEIPKGAVDSIFLRFDLFMGNMKNLRGKYTWESDKLFFVFDNFKIQILSSNELFIINEIFFHQCYNFAPDDQRRWNVIDIGMNVGLASLFFADKVFVDHVFSFEPFEETFVQAQVNFESNSQIAHKIHAYNFGIGKGNRIEKASYNPLSSGTSGIRFSQSEASPGVRVQAITLRDAHETLFEIFAGYSDMPFIMKIDCEGAEYDIIASLCENGFPEQVKVILMEWHGVMPEGFEAMISKNGFRMIRTRSKGNLGLIYAFR